VAVARLEPPIVLVHGLLGFDRVQVAGYTLANYFPGIFELLQGAGNRVYAPALSPTCSIAQRAGELRRFLLDSCPHERVHLFAHSMGGLDARYLISRLAMADHVATLTTIGTPHRGSPFADWGIKAMEWIVRPTLDFLQLPYEAFYDLTVARCRSFNEEVPDAPGVRYFSVAGEHDGNLAAAEWLLPYGIVKLAEGANDGVVSVQSARYGEACDLWPGDHLTLVNWLRPGRPKPDVLPRWEQLLGRLRDCGY
jgi:triacylglycerol lipase